MTDPFAAIREALNHDDDPASGAVTRGDPDRRNRTGVPEVVYGDSKPDDVLVAACAQLLERLPRVIVSRVAPARAALIAGMVGEDVRVEQPYSGTTSVLVRCGALPPSPGGRIAIFTAGSSDIPAAGEAATVAHEIGCHVEIIADVGVAGLHRLVRPLSRVINEGVGVIIVAAGMDGALPSVVSGLVNVPVIGLPTSVGYGVASGGQAALMTMLATCAPGMTVVNIDNGVGAGATVALIASRIHDARQSTG